MDIKLIAVDMDGTLLDHDHLTLPPRNIAALRAAADRGIVITLATGRTLCLLGDIIRELGVPRYALVSNGAGLVDLETGEWLCHLGLPETQWRAILKIFHAHHLSVETYADGMAYLNEADLRGVASLGFSKEFQTLFANRATIVSDVAAALTGKTVEKMHIFQIDSARRDSIMAELAATGPLVNASGASTNMEITVPQADKGKTLALLCARLNIPRESVMAFGDADNDLGMLSWAGMSFAMENGSSSAKAAAKYITGPNHEAGVAQAVERYILGQ